jgi:lysophospholipase L1-like esterase
MYRWLSCKFLEKRVMALQGPAKFYKLRAVVAVAICANVLTAYGQVVPDGAPPAATPPPGFSPFEQEITALETRPIELSQRPIVFYGSSSIRLWKSLTQDFVGYPVVNCGFGGSRLSDCVRYVSRVVLHLKPAAVVLYAGDNDLAQGVLPEQVFASFRELYRALRSYSEQMPIAYISVKPSPARLRNLDNILRFNRMVQIFLQNQPEAKYIDICTAMLGPDRKPNPALFVQDQIHLSTAGYQILRRDVSAFLATELQPAAASKTSERRPAAAPVKTQPAPTPG